jgi:hypothetical protein
MLKFSKGKHNSKLRKLEQLTGKTVYSFSLLSGHSCPNANECLAKVVIKNGRRRIKDGAKMRFRCFSASQEALYTNVYNQRKHNFELLKQAKTKKNIFNLLLDNLPKTVKIQRFHVAGDFYNQNYFDAAIELAKAKPDVLFYAYTKMANLWIKRKNNIPPNFILTYSVGGRGDVDAKAHKLRFAKVVFSEKEAADLNLEIDTDDRHSCLPKYRNESFALLLHNQQPAGSEAQKALKKLRKRN